MSVETCFLFLEDATRETPTANMLVHEPGSRIILDKFEEYQSFFADRVQRPEARYASIRKKENHQHRGKLLQHDEVTPEVQKLFDVSRLSEWNTYLKFEAVKLIPREDAEHMFQNTDAEDLPT